MKKHILIITSLFVFLSLQAQDIKVENQYLQIINRQPKQKLMLKNSLWNAQLCADSLIIRGYNNDSLAADFFINLATTYYWTRKYDLAIYTILAQQALFQYPDLLPRAEEILKRALVLYKKELNLQEYLDYFQNLNNKDKRERLLKLMQITFLLDSKDANEQIWTLVKAYDRNFKNETKPLWLAQWIMFNSINMKYKHQQIYLSFTPERMTTEYQPYDLLKGIQLSKKYIKRVKLYAADIQ